MSAAQNNLMFRRLVRRLLFANRGRLFVILLALSAGAAVSAALLNLQTDAKRRINSEFRSFGPNVLISPKQTGSLTNSLNVTLADAIPESYQGVEIAKTSIVYVAVSASVLGKSDLDGVEKPPTVILAGLDSHHAERVFQSTYVATADRVRPDMYPCRVGVTAAKLLGAQPRDILQFESGNLKEECFVSTIESFGGSEDSQILTLWLPAARLAGRNDFSLIQINVPGTPQQVQQFVSFLQEKIPDADVHPLRQFSEAQAEIYSRISGLLTAATAIILALTALCVMAAMTNIAAERKHDVGMMKAIGGSARNILSLFLAEAVLLGIIGGLIGAAAGITLSIALGKAVFGVAAAPRLIVYPISVALTVIVAILGAYPLRLLANVRPATIFRGEA
jgi:putative ABC transport system permease protein